MADVVAFGTCMGLVVSSQDLKHAFDEVLDVSRDLPRHVVITLLYFREKEGQLFVIKW